MPPNRHNRCHLTNIHQELVPNPGDQAKCPILYFSGVDPSTGMPQIKGDCTHMLTNRGEVISIAGRCAMAGKICIMPTQQPESQPQ